MEPRGVRTLFITLYICMRHVRITGTWTGKPEPGTYFILTVLLVCSAVLESVGMGKSKWRIVGLPDL